MRNTYYNFFVQDDIQVSQKLSINAGLRYQYDSTPGESRGYIANFNLDTGMLDPTRSNLFNAAKFNLAPRFGLAYSPFGTRGAVIRAAYGMYFGDVNAALAQNMPGNLSGQSSSLNSQQYPNLVGFPFPAISSYNAVTTLYAIARQLPGTYTEQWNLNVEQPLGSDQMLQVGYVGSRGLHLVHTRNLNRFYPGTSIRPYPKWGNITYYATDVNNYYNALRVSLKRRFRRGLSFDVNYTWGHSLDEGAQGLSEAHQDDTNPRGDYGNSNWDVRHMLEFNYTYALPVPRLMPTWLMGGWQVNGITTMRSGLPVNVTCGCDPMKIGVNTSRADVIPNVSPKPAQPDIPNNQINIKAFTAPGPGTWGNVGRNSLNGPAAYNWDFSLFRNFRLTESRSLQFRAEIFNVFNTPQFSNPGGNLISAGFGISQGTIDTVSGFSSNRQVQLALRYSF